MPVLQPALVFIPSMPPSMPPPQTTPTVWKVRRMQTVWPYSSHASARCTGLRSRVYTRTGCCTAACSPLLCLLPVAANSLSLRARGSHE